MKDEYRNGEWYANDIRTVYAADIPAADCWCFGFPCQDISVAGKQVGFYGNRSSLFFRVMYLLGQTEEAKKPAYLFIENVKNLLSVNGGWDFARLLSEMDRRGYDAEWQVLNSTDFGVPQNRERVFIAGYLRGRSAAKVFPLERTDGEDNLCEVRQIVQIFGTEAEPNPSGGRVYDAAGGHGDADAWSRSRNEPALHSTESRINIIGHRKGYRRNMQTFYPDGITEALDTGQGGGRGHHVAIPVNTDDPQIKVIGNTRLYDGKAKKDKERIFSIDGIGGGLCDQVTTKTRRRSLFLF